MLTRNFAPHAHPLRMADVAFITQKDFTMHVSKHLTSGILALILTIGLTPHAHASSTNMGSFTEYALQHHFTLTDDLLARYDAAHADVFSSPCKALPTPDYQAMKQGKMPTVDDVAAQYEAQPVMHVILTRHGITAKQYLLANAVIGAGSLKYGRQIMKKENPKAADFIDTSMTIISPANYSFYVAHRSQIQRARHQEMHAQSTADASLKATCLMNKLHGK